MILYSIWDEFSRFGDRHVKSESHKEYSIGIILYGRHKRLQIWRPFSIPSSWNYANSDDRRRRPGLDKRNFEGRWTRLSADQRSLRTSDRFDAPPPRVFAFVQTGVWPAVNNCWSHDRPSTCYFTNGACDRSVGPVTPRKSALALTIIHHGWIRHAYFLIPRARNAVD